jgi:hypothetical protein
MPVDASRLEDQTEKEAQRVEEVKQSEAARLAAARDRVKANFRRRRQEEDAQRLEAVQDLEATHLTTIRKGMGVDNEEGRSQEGVQCLAEVVELVQQPTPSSSKYEELHEKGKSPAEPESHRSTSPTRAEEPIDLIPSIHDEHQAIEELRNILALAEGKFLVPTGDFILFFPSFFKAQDWLATTKNPQHAWMQAVFAAVLHSNIGHKGSINIRVEEDLAAASRSFVADYVQEEHALTFEAFTQWLWPAVTAALRKVRTDRLGRKTRERGPPPNKKQRFQ